MTLPLGSPQSGGVMKSSAWGALGPIREIELLLSTGRHSCPQQAPGLCSQGVGRRQAPLGKGGWEKLPKGGCRAWSGRKGRPWVAEQRKRSLCENGMRCPKNLTFIYVN